MTMTAAPGLISEEELDSQVEGEVLDEARDLVGNLELRVQQVKNGILNPMEAAKALAQERQRVRRGFPQLRIASAHIADLTAIQVGDPVTARVEVDLGSLSPADVVVEMLLGHAADNGDLENRTAVPLTPTGKPANGVQAFEGTTRVEHSGHYACGLRVRPAMASSAGDSLSDLVLWA